MRGAWPWIWLGLWLAVGCDPVRLRPPEVVRPARPRPTAARRPVWRGGVTLRHLDLQTNLRQPKPRAQRLFSRALDREIRRAFPSTDSRLRPVPVDVTYRYEVFSKRSVAADIFNTLTAGLMAYAPEHGVALVEVTVRFHAAPGMVHQARQYRLRLSVVAPYSTSTVPWFDRAARQIRLDQAHRVAFQKILEHIRWWLEHPDAAPSTRAKVQVEGRDLRWYELRRRVTGASAFRQRERWRDAILGAEVVSAKQQSSILADIFQTVGGLALGYSLGFSWVDSEIRDPGGQRYTVASGQGRSQGAGVTLFVPPRKSGLYFYPTAGFLFQQIRIQDQAGLADVVDLEGSTEIPAVATDPDTGVRIDLGAPWGYQLLMTSLYFGARVGVSAVFGTDRTEFYMAAEGGVNLLEWRYMRVRWDDFRTDGHRFSGAGSFSGRLILGFTYRPWHVSLLCIGTFDYYRQFKYPEPIPYRGRMEYNPDLDVYERPTRWADAVTLKTLNLFFGLVGFY